MAQNDPPKKPEAGQKRGKRKYIKPAIAFGGSLIAMTKSDLAVATCCLTTRLRVALTSPRERRALLREFSEILR